MNIWAPVTIPPQYIAKEVRAMPNHLIITNQQVIMNQFITNQLTIIQNRNIIHLHILHILHILPMCLT